MLLLLREEKNHWWLHMRKTRKRALITGLAAALTALPTTEYAKSEKPRQEPPGTHNIFVMPLSEEQLFQHRIEEKKKLISQGVLDTVTGGYIVDERGRPDVEYNLHHAMSKQGPALFNDRLHHGPRAFARLIGTTAGRGGSTRDLESFIDNYKGFLVKEAEQFPYVTPETALAIIDVETTGLGKAVSLQGAIGIAQLTKYLYLDHRYNNQDTTIWEAINPLHIEPAINRMMHHLNDLYEQGYSERNVFAIYNQGPKNRTNQDGQDYADKVFAARRRLAQVFKEEEAPHYATMTQATPGTPARLTAQLARMKERYAQHFQDAIADNYQ